MSWAWESMMESTVYSSPDVSRIIDPAKRKQDANLSNKRPLVPGSYRLKANENGIIARRGMR